MKTKTREEVEAYLDAALSQSDPDAIEREVQRIDKQLETERRESKRKRKTLIYWTVEDHQRLVDTFIETGGDLKATFSQFPDKTRDQLYSRLRNLYRGLLTFHKPDERFEILFERNSKRPPVFTANQRRQVIEILKTYGRDYNRLSEALNIPRKLMNHKINKFKKQYARLSVRSEEEAYIFEALTIKAGPSIEDLRR